MDDPTDEYLEAHAEEWYLNPDNLLDHYEREYTKHKNTGFEQVYAIRLIQVYVELERPIPVKLYRFIGMACEAWKESKGPRQKIRSANTDSKWALPSENIDILIKIHGISVDDAMEKMKPANSETLRKMYYQRKKDKPG